MQAARLNEADLNTLRAIPKPTEALLKVLDCLNMLLSNTASHTLQSWDFYKKMITDKTFMPRLRALPVETLDPAVLKAIKGKILDKLPSKLEKLIPSCKGLLHFLTALEEYYRARL